MDNIPVIPKESIPEYKFVANEVLSTEEERKERFSKLQKAMLLGNGYKVKVKITFLTEEGAKKVDTTVWEASENQLLVKGDVLIPIHSILNVEL